MGLFGNKRQLPADNPPDAQSDLLATIKALKDGKRHDYLRDECSAGIREQFFEENPKDRLKYYRREPDHFRAFLKKRLEEDPEFEQWTKLAGYKLDDPAFDPIVLGLMWDAKKKIVNEANRGFGKPFIVSRDLMKEGHMHIRGRTRSGKSALAITPLLQQLIRPYQAKYQKEGETEYTYVPMRDPIFVIDLGGDLALFNFAKKLADDNDREFRFLSLEEKDAWQYFDPFESAGYGSKRVVQIAILLQNAFSLDHGLAYAASYFTSRNLFALLDVVRKLYAQAGSGSVSIDDVANYLEQENVKDAEEIRMIFRFLTEYQQLKPFDFQKPPETGQPLPDNVINIERALNDGEVIYFFLPTLAESITARQIAGLALYTLIHAAQQRVRKPENQGGKPLPHAWVFVDEFQQLAGSSYANVLAQASKFGLSLIMANQTTTQLDVRNLNLADIVRDNTYAKLYFTITGEQDVKALKSFSMEDRDILFSQPETRLGIQSGTLQEYLTTVLKTDDILATSATNQHCYVLLDDGTGHREPVRLWMDYAMSLQEFRVNKSKPPPLFNGERPKSLVAGKLEPLWKMARKKMASPAWQTPMNILLEQKRKEEDFDEVSN